MIHRLSEVRAKMGRPRHVVLCRGARNADHSSLKQKGNPEPIQTKDLALVSEVGGGLHEASASDSCAGCTPALGLLELQPEGLAKGGRGGGEGSTKGGVGLRVLFPSENPGPALSSFFRHSAPFSSLQTFSSSLSWEMRGKGFFSFSRDTNPCEQMIQTMSKNEPQLKNFAEILRCTNPL